MHGRNHVIITVPVSGLEKAPELVMAVAAVIDHVIVPVFVIVLDIQFLHYGNSSLIKVSGTGGLYIY